MERLLQKAEAILDRLERLLPREPEDTDWNALAWRWQRRHGHGHLQAVRHPHHVQLDELLHLDDQKAVIVRNTEQFVRGLPANNVLLTGARGTGKSSLVKALLTEFAEQGLRLVEVEKQDLQDLPEIVELLRSRPERFIIFCDDLSFEAGDSGYKALKVVLDGTLAATSDNVLVYATSNRRHLLPEYMSENLETRYVGEEVRPGDSTEEKISLSERFGLRLTFYTFDQEQYLQIARGWLADYGVTHWDEEVRLAALQFAQERGMRSGRVAYQFARDYAGRQGLGRIRQP
ncbi:MAG TPA: ATP-binding protein [Methylophilaceae bacterium]|jgi:predicted AAA+ superfamily ATPase